MKVRGGIMSKKDEVTKNYMSDSTVFADAFNFFIYKGEKVIKPEQLNAVDVTEIMMRQKRWLICVRLGKI